MKKLKIYLGCLFLLTGFFAVSIYGYSQDTKPDKKSRKEAKRAEAEANFRTLDSLLYTGGYVLEAEYLQNKYGSRVYVTSTLNFIKVELPNGVLQTGSDTRQGYNGVGGVTAEGTVSKYHIERDFKNLNFIVTFNLSTSLGTFNIMMTVSSSNNATATISGSTSGRLTWDGHLVTLNKSRVFKGMNTI
jgi:hypothetical protein